jgi:hypothetical protein
LLASDQNEYSPATSRVAGLESQTDIELLPFRIKAANGAGRAASDLMQTIGIAVRQKIFAF